MTFEIKCPECGACKSINSEKFEYNLKDSWFLDPKSYRGWIFDSTSFGDPVSFGDRVMTMEECEHCGKYYRLNLDITISVSVAKAGDK